jgi:hypothetical protein
MTAFLAPNLPPAHAAPLEPRVISRTADAPRPTLAMRRTLAPDNRLSSSHSRTDDPDPEFPPD